MIRFVWLFRPWRRLQALGIRAEGCRNSCLLSALSLLRPAEASSGNW